MSPPLRAILAFLLLLSAPISAQAAGPELVRQQLPLLYRAWEEVAGEEETLVYFRNWDESEINFIRAKHRPLLAATAPSLPTLLSADRIHDSYGGICFGTSGEVYGNVVMREAAESIPGAIFLDEIGYEQLNPEGNKPDGVLFKLADQTLLILGILESKLGGQSWSQSQAEGYLRRWRHAGLTVPTPEGPRVFRPDSIAFQLGNDQREISAVTLDELASVATLIGTAPDRVFAGRYVHLPVDATTLREVGERYIHLLHGGRPAPRGASDLPAPVLTGEALDSYRQALRDYVLERGDWPKTGIPGLSADLARHVSRRLGQGSAFIYDLDGATRHYLARHGDMPAQYPLENHLKRAKPDDANALSALRAYLYRYERRSYGTKSDVAQRLALASRLWQDYFQRVSIDQLRGANLDELNDCLDRLVQLAKQPTEPTGSDAAGLGAE